MKKVQWVLLAPYCLFIVWSTILFRHSGVPKTDLRFMWSYQEMLTGDPNWKKDVIQNLQNIAFFIPFGVLFPVNRWWFVIIAADSFSTVIEIVQYIGGYGFAEIDDVTCNTLGAMISFWIFLGLKRGMDETL